MPPIRTDKAGLALLAAGGAVFIFLCTVPAMMTLEAGLHMDALLLSCLTGGLVFGGAFVIGHMVLRRIGLGSRAWYAALGACALALAYASRMRPVDLEAVADQGLVAYFFILPMLAGAAMGFLYAFKAGWEIGDDSPEALAVALEETAARDGEAFTAPALVRAGETEYFAGPLQVRTSFPLMILAAALAMALAGAARALLVLGFEASHLADRSNAAVIDHTAQASLFVGLEMGFIILIGVVPITLSVLAGHLIARGFRTHVRWAYFAIGLVAPAVLALLSMGALIGIGLAIALPSAVGLLLYRNFAGLEPVPVREDIRVGDERALIPADHPRRQFGRIVRSR